MAQVRLGANGDWLAYVREGTNINLHNIHTGETVPVEPMSSIGIGHAMGHDRNWYNETTVGLKKIAIAEAPTRSCGNKYYCLIAVFDIAIAFMNHPARGGQSWTMLVAADLLSYEYEDVMLFANRIFAVTN